MDIGDLPYYSDVKPLLIPLQEIAHLVLEPTYECNIRCKICYSQRKSYSKTLEELKEEIRIAQEKRRLDTISILGGEPTLYPQLVELIRYITSLGLHCQMLTNGIRFLQPDGKDFLQQLMEAGLERILIHADEGQTDKKNISAFCHSVFRLLEEQKIFFGLTMTMYDDNASLLPAKIREFSPYRYFDGILATLAKDTEDIFRGGSSLTPTMQDVVEPLSELGIRPASYLPTSANRKKIGWLIYFYYINAETGLCVPLSGRMVNLFRKLYRKITGRQFFSARLSVSWFIPMVISIMGLQMLIGPDRRFRFRSLWKMVRHSHWFFSLRFQYIVLQEGPQYNPETGEVEICYHCPDATIRNGKLTPVCLADNINPLKKFTFHPRWQSARNTIFRHLGELP